MINEENSLNIAVFFIVPKNRTLNVLFLYECAVFGGECTVSNNECTVWSGAMYCFIFEVESRLYRMVRCGEITNLYSI